MRALSPDEGCTAPSCASERPNVAHPRPPAALDLAWPDGQGPCMDDNLLVKNVRPMAAASADVLVSGGTIQRLASSIAAPEGCAVIDGSGGILLPAFVDGHMHLDKTFWGLPWRSHEAGPTVPERIENERRLRRLLQLAPDVQIERLARQAISRGTLHIRNHTDIDTE